MMNKTHRDNQTRMFARLAALGISADDALSLRRIERTLQRWSVRECGSADGTAIERDEETGIPYETWETPYGPRGRRQIHDREKGALERLARIMAQYPALVAYHQTDPRGCALYILTRAELGTDSIEQVYTRGVAVCY